MKLRSRLTPHLLLGVLILGTGLGLGLGLSDAPMARVVRILPMGWKPVIYHDVVVDVPGAWSVEPWYPQCGVTASTVFIGPVRAAVLNCPLYSPGGAEVVLGALPHPDDRIGTVVILNGMNARVFSEMEKISHGSPRPTVGEVYVDLLTKHLWISIVVGESAKLPGGAPGRADRIEHTIHLVRAS